MEKSVIKERNCNIDLLRIFSAFAIVVLHVSSKSLFGVELLSHKWIAFVLYDLAVRWAVPVFVMISGIFFLDADKEIPLKKLYSKNILRLVAAYIFWSLIYAVEHCFMKNYGTKDFLLDFVNGEDFLWFLIMMAALYIYTPLLRKITENRKTEKYFLIVFGFFFCVLPTILSFISPQMFDKINALFLERTQLSLFCGIVGIYYSFYYVLGHFLHNTEFTVMQRILIYLLGVIVFAVSMIATCRLSQELNKIATHFFRFLSLTVAIESVAVFVLFDNIKIKPGNKSKKLIGILSKCSFGVYLAHLLILDIFYYFGCKTTSFNSFISVPVISLAVFAAAFVISYILNKLPFINKYIV